MVKKKASSGRKKRSTSKFTFRSLTFHKNDHGSNVIRFLDADEDDLAKYGLINGLDAKARVGKVLELFLKDITLDDNVTQLTYNNPEPPDGVDF